MNELYYITITTGVNIDAFLSYYRRTFSEATVLPKQHMLEDHVIPWLKEWRVGFGCMGEQGAESIHSSFNTVERAYASTANRVERLQGVLRHHHLQVNPDNVALKPTPAKRKKE